MPWRYRWGPVFVIIFLTFAAFMPALQALFVDWDDDRLLLFQEHHHSFSIQNLRWMFTTSLGGHFQPLTWISYALDYAIWDGAVFGYHLTNVVLHLLNAILFYFLGRRLLSLALDDGASKANRSIVLGATLAALLFADHPLRAESVAWLAERRDVLAGVFYLLAITVYVKYAAPPVEKTLGQVPSPKVVGRAVYYWLAVAFCGASLLSKALAMTLPFVLLVVDLYPLRRLRGRFANGGGTWRWILWEKMPFLLLAVLGGVRALIAQRDGGALYDLAGHDWLARLAQACYGLTFYVRKSLWPNNLGPLYTIPPRAVLFGAMFWWSLLGVVTTAVLLIRWRRCCPALLASFAIYVVILSPVLGFAQSGPQLVADRYSYLSCLSLALLVGGGFTMLLRSDWIRRSMSRVALTLLIPCVPIFILVNKTVDQNYIWEWSVSLWTRGVQVCPSAIALTNLGDSYAHSNEYEIAAQYYGDALERNPKDAVAWHHLGDIHKIARHNSTAIECYLRALRIDPGRRHACLSLGQLLVEAGRATDAMRVLRDGMRRHPNDFDLLAYVARVLSSHPNAEIRDGAEAVLLAKRVAAARGAGAIAARITLADAFAEAGQYSDAVTTAEAALAEAERRTEVQLVFQLRNRLSLFRRQQPYRWDP